MVLPRRDVVATVFVGAAGAAYALWAADALLRRSEDTRLVAIVVLALGFAASATAVVPSFERLIRGNRAYLAVSAVLGVLALVSGLRAVLTGSDVALTVLIATTVVLWAMATVHHVLLAEPAGTRPTRTSSHRLRHA